MGLLRRVARARLAAQVIRRLRRAGLADVRYDRRGFQVRFRTDGDDEPTFLELAPLLAGRGKRRRKELDRFVATIVPAARLALTWREIKPLLRPVLRGGTPGSPLSRPVLPFLSEFVVIDQPDTMTYVAPDQPAAWGVSAEKVFATARANLSGAVLQGVAREPVVVRFVDDGDAYWTSHLLLANWLDRLAGQVGGEPVAFAPERGTLLVTADGSDHLRRLFVQAEEIYAKSSRPISPMAYTSDASGCPIPYAAPAGHPLHRAVERAERVLAVEEYARQAVRIANPAPPAIDNGRPSTNQLDAGHREDRRLRISRPDGSRRRHGQLEIGEAEAGGREAGKTEAGQRKNGDGEAGGREESKTEAGRRKNGNGEGGGREEGKTEAGRYESGESSTPGPGHGGGRGRGVPAGIVVELQLVGSDERGWRTRAVWEHDEPALLPTADEIQLGDQICPWREVAQHFARVPGLDPPRWSAPGWPS